LNAAFQRLREQLVIIVEETEEFASGLEQTCMTCPRDIALFEVAPSQSFGDLEAGRNVSCDSGAITDNNHLQIDMCLVQNTADCTGKGADFGQLTGCGDDHRYEASPRAALQ